MAAPMFNATNATSGPSIGAVLPQLGCTASLPEDWEKTLPLTLGVLVIVLVLYDYMQLRHRFYYLFNLRIRSGDLLLIPGWYALFNILMIYAKPTSFPYKMLLGDMQAVLRAWYLYLSMSHNFECFNSVNGGFRNTAEAVEIVGEMLEQLNLPPQKVIAPFLVPWWGCRYIQPNKAFLNSCVRRMQLSILVTFLILIFRQVIHDHGHLYPKKGETQWEAANIWLAILNLLIVGLAISAQNPLVKLIDPVILPGGRTVVTMRKIQFFFLFSIIGTIQGIISLITSLGMQPACYWWVYHQNVFVAFELCIVACLGHKAWCPPYEWGAGLAPIPVLQKLIDMANSKTGHFPSLEIPSTTLSPEQIAEVLSGKRKIEEVRAEFIGDAKSWPEPNLDA
mmetsp:Transcript_39051/g.63129  ORF Transcript_39051/g.63129 Transcript_39051/m.63129 type:complete len:393 (+) Transcript_39051:94-1272(+)